jgi:hypothetical protein
LLPGIDPESGKRDSTIAGRAARATSPAGVPGLHCTRPRRFIEFLQIIRFFQCIQMKFQVSRHPLTVTIFRWLAAACVLLSLVCAAAGQPAHKVWLGSNKRPLPFSSIDEIQNFLRQAQVVSVKDIETGVTRPWKVRLDQDGIQANAIFRYVDLFKKRLRSENGLRKNFRDSYRYECAAFELSRLFGFSNVPPAVFRTVKGKPGSLQLWIENSMTEEERRDQGLEPPDQKKWSRNYQMMYLFDNLIFNDDRNYGNILADKTWNFWMIDATRAFVPLGELKTPSIVRVCSRRVWDRLQNVTDDEIKERLKDILKDSELEPLLVRRELLVEHLRREIEARGEGQVLFVEN